MNVSAFDIRERYNSLSSQNTVYSYLGTLPKGEMNDMLTSMEVILETNIEKRIVRKKLFQMLIEITQNLYNYLEDDELMLNYKDIFLLVKEHKNDYYIITGNYLQKKEIPGIRTRIDMVNAMTEKEVKELYRGILDFGGVSNGGGAGLGFVDLARRSGEDLVYKFEDIEGEFSFFTLEVKVTC